MTLVLPEMDLTYSTAEWPGSVPLVQDVMPYRGDRDNPNGTADGRECLWLGPSSTDAAHPCLLCRRRFCAQSQ